MSGTEVDDRVDVGTALHLLGADEPPYACCPTDGEPLISTMERRGAEFHCLVCGRWLGFLSPTPKAPTPELTARHAQLQALFDAGQRGPLEVAP